MEDDVISYGSSFRVKRSKFAPQAPEGLKFDFHLSKKLIMAAGLVAVVGVAAVGAIYFTTNRIKKQQEIAIQNAVTPVQRDLRNTIDLGFEQGEIDLGQEDVTDYVPFDAQFYVEGTDFTAAHALLLGPIDGESLFDGFTGILDNRYVAFGDLVPASEFSPVEEEGDEDTEVSEEQEGLLWKLGLVVFVKEEFKDFDAIEFPELENTYAKKIGDGILVTNYEPYIDEVEETSVNISKNISHSPSFSSARALVPREGQLMFLHLEGEIQDLYNLIDVYNPGVEFLKHLEQIKTKGYDKFVVINNE